jgi:hypothetical protein
MSIGLDDHLHYDPFPKPAPPPRPATRKYDVQVSDAGLLMPFPLRPDFLSYVIVPRDLSKAESDRLCAFVASLAQPANALDVTGHMD